MKFSILSFSPERYSPLFGIIFTDHVPLRNATATATMSPGVTLVSNCSPELPKPGLPQVSQQRKHLLTPCLPYRHHHQDRWHDHVHAVVEPAKHPGRRGPRRRIQHLAPLPYAGPVLDPAHAGGMVRYELGHGEVSWHPFSTRQTELGRGGGCSQAN
jgi:hypothetical protein